MASKAAIRAVVNIHRDYDISVYAAVIDREMNVAEMRETFKMMQHRLSTGLGQRGLTQRIEKHIADLQEETQ